MTVEQVSSRTGFQNLDYAQSQGVMGSFAWMMSF